MTSGEKYYYGGFKKLIQKVLNDIKTTNITETNNIINTTTTFAARYLGLNSGGNRQKSEKNRGRQKNK